MIKVTRKRVGRSSCEYDLDMIWVTRVSRFDGDRKLKGSQ
jgi:hypothetical protein